MMKRVIAVILLMTTLLSLTGIFSANAEQLSVDETDWFTLGAGKTSYRLYYEKYKNTPRPNQSIEVDLFNYVADQKEVGKTNDLTGKFAEGLYTTENGNVSWPIHISKEGFYAIEITYLPVAGKGSTITRSIWIDHEKPYDEAANVLFYRAFKNVDTEKQFDVNGNQIKSSQVEDSQWETSYVSDALGLFDQPLGFYLSEGDHVLTIESVREPMIIGQIRLCAPTFPVYKDQEDEKNNEIDEIILLEGEDADRKSSSSIYPISDRYSSATSPSSSSKILLNVIGGDKWKEAGQWIEWKFQVTESQAGNYKIGFKARQNTSPGQVSYRKIYIDGKEIENNSIISFPYKNQWDIYSVGGEAPLLVHLNAGEHTIRMEVVLGDLASLVEQIKYTMTRLNEIYMNFLVVVGPQADTNRDYDFGTLFADELEQMREISETLYDVCERYIAICGTGSQSQQLNSFAWQLNRMCDQPDKIAELFQEFINNISALGTWMTSVMSQPLEIDYIVLCPEHTEYPDVKNQFFTQLCFMVEKFLYSFTEDYETIGVTGTADTEITVWTASGRDQANVINQLVIDDYTHNHNIKVNLQLVSAGTLLNATLAGKGPDISLSNSQSDPLNFAIRGAVVDLKQFEDYSKIEQQFLPSALTPLSYNGAVYGIPETQSFPIMLYRTDVMEKLNLDVPETWDDVIDVIIELQKNHMTFGMPQPYVQQAVGAGITSYAMLLYQEGGRFYDENGTSALFDSDEAITAFNKWVDYYNSYGLEVKYDFLTRFRSGEIPIGIVDYAVYNSLSVFAPELNGLYEFALVPGVSKNGEINHSVASSVTATMMMSASKHKNACWDFIKWWTSASVQTRYGREIESIMGTAGRYQPANTETLEQMSWTVKELETLLKQREWTVGMPEIPGSYMTPRYIEFAFLQARNNASIDSSESIINANRLINIEINEKLKEFGLKG